MKVAIKKKMQKIKRTNTASYKRNSSDIHKVS